MYHLYNFNQLRFQSFFLLTPPSVGNVSVDLSFKTGIFKPVSGFSQHGLRGQTAGRIVNNLKFPSQDLSLSRDNRQVMSDESSE